MSDHYAALGLGSAATLADIKKAFRQKASLYHPDRNTAPEAPARFRAVQEAYDVLSDPDKEVTGYGENDRGVSFTFGPDVVGGASRTIVTTEHRE